MAVTRRYGGAEVPEVRAGVITSLVAKGSSGERIVVYVDEVRAFDISSEVADKASLHKDELLSAERQRELLREDEPFRARELAIGMLGRRDLLSSEVAARLTRKGISPQHASATVAWLCERGYVDDRRYAETYLRLKAKTGWGRQRVVAELSKKGMPRNEVLAVWQEWEESQDLGAAREALVEMVKGRFAAQLQTDPEGAKRRMSSFLARRGHDWETIAAVVRTVEGID